MSDSPIESTKELHESKERKPKMTQRTENYVRNSDQLLVKAAPSMGWRGWMKVYLPNGDAYRVIGEEFDRDFTRVALPRGAEPEPVPPRGEAETPTDTDQLEDILDAYDDALSEARSTLLRTFRELDELRSANKKKLRALLPNLTAPYQGSNAD